MELKLDAWQKEVLEHEGDICLRTGRQVGKSTVIAIKAAEYAINNPKSIVVIGAAIERQASHIFWMVKNYFFDNYPKLLKGRPTTTFLELENGSKINCVPIGDDGLGIRGFTSNLTIIDEAAFVNPKAWSGITPTLATTKGSLILLSTPFGTSGYFYDCYHDPNFLAKHISSEDCPRITPEFLAGEKLRMTNLQYQQEYLGLFVGGIQRFISEEEIDRICTLPADAPNTSKGIKYLGVDVARMGGDETVLCSVNRINRDKIVMTNLEIPEPQLLTDTARLILRKDLKFNYKKIYIDSVGMGWGVFDPLHENRQTREKTVAILSAKSDIDKLKGEKDPRKQTISKEDLALNLKVLIENNKIKLFDLPEIRQSLRSMQYENTTGKLKIYGNYDHIFDAIKFASHCMKDKSLNILAFC